MNHKILLKNGTTLSGQVRKLSNISKLKRESQPSQRQPSGSKFLAKTIMEEDSSSSIQFRAGPSSRNRSQHQSPSNPPPRPTTATTTSSGRNPKLGANFINNPTRTTTMAASHHDHGPEEVASFDIVTDDDGYESYDVVLIHNNNSGSGCGQSRSPASTGSSCAAAGTNKFSSVQSSVGAAVASTSVKNEPISSRFTSHGSKTPASASASACAKESQNQLSSATPSSNGLREMKQYHYTGLPPSSACFRIGPIQPGGESSDLDLADDDNDNDRNDEREHDYFGGSSRKTRINKYDNNEYLTTAAAATTKVASASASPKLIKSESKKEEKFHHQRSSSSSSRNYDKGVGRIGKSDDDDEDTESDTRKIIQRHSGKLSSFCAGIPRTPSSSSSAGGGGGGGGRRGSLVATRESSSMTRPVPVLPNSKIGTSSTGFDDDVDEEYELYRQKSASQLVFVTEQLQGIQKTQDSILTQLRSDMELLQLDNTRLKKENEVLRSRTFKMNGIIDDLTIDLDKARRELASAGTAGYQERQVKRKILERPPEAEPEEQALLPSTRRSPSFVDLMTQYGLAHLISSNEDMNPLANAPSPSPPVLQVDQPKEIKISSTKSSSSRAQRKKSASPGRRHSRGKSRTKVGTGTSSQGHGREMPSSSGSKRTQNPNPGGKPNLRQKSRNEVVNNNRDSNLRLPPGMMASSRSSSEENSENDEQDSGASNHSGQAAAKAKKKHQRQRLSRESSFAPLPAATPDKTKTKDKKSSPLGKLSTMRRTMNLTRAESKKLKRGLLDCFRFKKKKKEKEETDKGNEAEEEDEDEGSEDETEKVKKIKKHKKKKKQQVQVDSPDETRVSNSSLSLHVQDKRRSQSRSNSREKKGLRKGQQQQQRVHGRSGSSRSSIRSATGSRNGKNVAVTVTVSSDKDKAEEEEEMEDGQEEQEQ